MVVAEGTKGTDVTFSQFLKIGGEALLKLLKIKNTTNYSLKSVVLKDQILFPDVEGIPMLQGNQERIYFEFQGYPDKMTLHRLCSRASLACALPTLEFLLLETETFFPFFQIVLFFLKG